MISQLAAYGALWIVFPVVVFAAARWGGWRGTVVAHVAIAVLIVALDLRWIANNGLHAPETRLGTAIAIGLRATLINAILLPLSVIALKTRRHDPGPVA
jgi:hypothetical protein